MNLAKSMANHVGEAAGDVLYRHTRDPLNLTYQPVYRR